MKLRRSQQMLVFVVVVVVGGADGETNTSSPRRGHTCETFTHPHVSSETIRPVYSAGRDIYRNSDVR